MMKNACKLILFSILFSGLLGSFTTITHNPGLVEIEWADSLEGDFSFSNKWNYRNGIYRNQFGQLSCDGLCPERVHSMKDEKGKFRMIH